MAVANQPERAAQLLGAAHVLREVIAALPSGIHALHLDSVIQKARDAMAESDFAFAWSKGKAMSLDMAIEHAMEVRVARLN